MNQIIIRKVSNGYVCNYINSGKKDIYVFEGIETLEDFVGVFAHKLESNKKDDQIDENNHQQ